MSTEPVKFVNWGPAVFAGLDRPYTFQQLSEIPDQWHKFGPSIGTLPVQVGKVAYGISHEMTMEGFAYMSGIEVSGTQGLPEEFAILNLPVQRYAVFVHEGHVSTLCNTVDGIWQQWLATSGEQVPNPPLMIERCGEGFDPQVGQGDLEVWVAVKEK